MTEHSRIQQLKEVAQRLLESIETLMPDFKGFSDPRFIEREITHKERVIHDAGEQLSKENLQQLLQQEKYETFYEHVLAIGQHPDSDLKNSNNDGSDNSYKGSSLSKIADELIKKEERLKIFYLK